MNFKLKMTSGDWIKAALIRAIKTIAQTALGMITVGAAISEINWLHILSVSLVAGIASLLTSIATDLPEASFKENKEIEEEVSDDEPLIPSDDSDSE